MGALHYALVQTYNDVIYFFGEDNIYSFDGYNTVPIGDGNNKYIFDGLNEAQVSRSFSFADKNTSEIHFVIPHNNSDIPNLDCIYNVSNKTWTFDEYTATAGCERMGLDYPLIARADFTRSSSSSSSESSSSSSSASSISSSSSSSSVSSSSESSSSSSQSLGEIDTDAKSYLMYTGTTDNDDDWARSSEFITGEYAFVSSENYEFDSLQIKEINNIVPVIEELSGDVELYIGTRNRITEDITWNYIDSFTSQELTNARVHGSLISFKFVANDLDDYYRISELMGYYNKRGYR